MSNSQSGLDIILTIETIWKSESSQGQFKVKVIFRIKIKFVFKLRLD